ncbi:helix-turn-helix domain-containing protein [Nocardioides allogilvus]|uniref:helix-turn-helix domain-containing protein n=1 Tax=Nocardioides allogilvus TaxID=2072017 RepID=UPI000D30F1E5|nr:helix-turn-helix domain-containing protein [Nocardioides allogilvus]
MGAAELRDTDLESAAGSETTESLSLTPDAVEVRRNAGLAAGVGAIASAVAIAYLARAVGGGGALDWLLATVMGLLGGYWLLTFVDARTPLLVADAHGIRIRLGRTWRGLPWSAVEHVEHTPRRGLLRDGRLVISAHNEEKLLAELDSSGRRQAKLSTRLYGAPFAVPLGLATQVVGAGDDLGTALEQVAHQAGDVVVIDPTLATAVEESEPVETAPLDEEDDTPHARPSLRDPRPLLAAGIAKLASMAPKRRQVDAGEDLLDEVEDDVDVDVELDDEPVVASETPAPLRESTAGRRSDARLDLPVEETELEGRELRRPGSVSLVEDTQVWGDRVRPIAKGGDAVDPIVLDDFEVEPAVDPVIGPELAAARTRLGLSVDQLADRTRIRPHVIESIEVDDFAPCGGDFYARGHLRTLARVLGVDVAPLLASYDERYAHAEINPRRVFEAELATGANGSIRSTRGGPNWSMLVAVVMALVLCWSIARLVMDAPPELRGSAPVLNGSGGPGGGGSTSLGDPVPVVLSATTGGAHIVVRDGAGEIVFKGNLAVGDTKELDAAPPVRVQTTDGAVTVSLDGEDAKPIGESGVAGQGTYVAR